MFTSRKKKDKRGKKAKLAEKEAEAIDEALQEHLNTLHRPRLTDLIPCKIVTGVVSFILAIPSYLEEFKRWREEKKVMVESTDIESEEEEGEGELVYISRL